ncbi:ATP-binding protein [Chitinimonas naiadis]
MSEAPLVQGKKEAQEIESRKFVADILIKLKKGETSETELSTDEKVLARVTDGIYRQPSSAVRELISNAYDADATNVTIETDAPRFENITIRDDGNGMSVEAITNLIHHIGGSAKRDSTRPNLGITDTSDPSLSPKKKRKLIGKIGIGLFSVAQLTREFSIITKTVGCDYYIAAHITLNNYSEEQLAEHEKRGQSFKTGSVKISTIPTENLDAHGTDIILKNIKKSARDQLKSVGTWLQESNNSSSGDEGYASAPVETPEFHIGCTFRNNDHLIEKQPSLPWQHSDEPDEKFKKLHQAMLNLAAITVSPKLELDLDNYLNMLWTLGLSVPVRYLDEHPFSLSGQDFPQIYRISNAPKGKAEALSLPVDSTIKELLSLKTNTTPSDFNVVIDGVQIFRPISFNNLPSTSAAVKKPILFIGGAKPDTSRIDSTVSGGSLEFEAYILWCPKVIPKEHNGVILRIHNSTGVLFDPTFMKYQIAEHVIKGQLTIEIFVSSGLDSALNIDRESFNIAHPHYQIIMRWLHEAIRQVVAKYKEIKREKLHIKKSERGHSFLQTLNAEVEEIARGQGKDPDEIRDIIINDKSPGESNNSATEVGSYKISKLELDDWIGKAKTEFSTVLEERAKAIIKVLDSFDLVDSLPQNRQKELFRAIVKILSVEGQ